MLFVGEPLLIAVVVVVVVLCVLTVSRLHVQEGQKLLLLYTHVLVQLGLCVLVACCCCDTLMVIYTQKFCCTGV